jgi:hypothetical protein
MGIPVIYGNNIQEIFDSKLSKKPHKNLIEILYELKELFLRRNNERGENKLNYNSQNDFDEYWDLYTASLGIWRTNISINPDLESFRFVRLLSILPLFNYDNYVDWFSQIEKLENQETIERASFAFLIFGIALLLATSPYELGIIVGLIGTILILFAGYVNIGYYYYIYYGQKWFNQLRDMEIDIHIRFLDNATGQGIDNIHLQPNYIKAINMDAVANCDDSSGMQKEDFTYYFELNNEIKENETGWYSLSMRGDSFEEKYKKPPCPPGTWELEVFSDGYVKIENIEVTILEGCTKIIGPIHLIQEEI